MLSLKVTNGNVLLCLIQSSCSISFDQTHHIITKIHDPILPQCTLCLHASMHLPFPNRTSIEQLLNESPPLTGINLQTTETEWKFRYHNLLLPSTLLAVKSPPFTKVLINQFPTMILHTNLWGQSRHHQTNMHSPPHQYCSSFCH
jgi:hypothetical protein